MDMNYEIVELKEMNVIGFSITTSNASPQMEADVEALWGRLYQTGAYETIEEKVNEKAIGAYTDYEKDENGSYTAFAGCETKSMNVPKEMCRRSIPAGRYAKFVVFGPMQQAVAQFWQRLWNMDLDRSFVFDFEEYQNADMEHATIHIYIGLKI